MDIETGLIVFQDKAIRRTWHEKQWWFVIEDVVAVLTDSKDPKGYLKDMRRRDEALAEGWGHIATPLTIATLGGPQQMNCASTEGTFRLIQSIPSKKAEPFKLWLAQVGYDRVKEIEDPELAQKRMRELYVKKGYSDAWIEKRVRGIVIRDELTEEWKKRDVKTDREYAMLTAEISKATFDMTPAEYKRFKSLKRENLRDHMDDLELIFSMLGEASTTAITRTKNAKGVPENKVAATKGGTIAGNARKELERETSQPVSKPDNYLDVPEKMKRLQKDDLQEETMELRPEFIKKMERIKKQQSIKVDDFAKRYSSKKNKRS